MKTPTFILERQLDKLANASLLKFQDGIKCFQDRVSMFTFPAAPFGWMAASKGHAARITRPPFANSDCEVLIQWIEFLKIYFKRRNDAGILNLRIFSVQTNPQTKTEGRGRLQFGWFSAFL